MTANIFDTAFYEERGMPDGSLGAVAPPKPVPTGHRTELPGHYALGSTSEFRTAPEWLRMGRETALAKFALKNG